MASPKPCSFRLDEDLLAWVKAYAKERDAAMSAVVEGALIEYQRKVGRMKKGPPLPERTQPVGSRRAGPKGQPKTPAWLLSKGKA